MFPGAFGERIGPFETACFKPAHMSAHCSVNPKKEACQYPLSSYLVVHREGFVDWAVALACSFNETAITESGPNMSSSFVQFLLSHQGRAIVETTSFGLPLMWRAWLLQRLPPPPPPPPPQPPASPNTKALPGLPEKLSALARASEALLLNATEAREPRAARGFGRLHGAPSLGDIRTYSGGVLGF